MTFCDNLLKSFSDNFKQLTKMDDFLSFLSFSWKTVGFCTFFIADMNSAWQKYPSNCIIIEFP